MNGPPDGPEGDAERRRIARRIQAFSARELVYHLLDNNCQHFAFTIRFGLPRSPDRVRLQRALMMGLNHGFNIGRDFLHGPGRRWLNWRPFGGEGLLPRLGNGLTFAFVIVFVVFLLAILGVVGGLTGVASTYFRSVRDVQPDEDYEEDGSGSMRNFKQ